MVQTHGLTHINLAVRDLGRALRFYEQVFGLREYGRGDGLVHTQASGRHDIVTFVEDPTTAGLSGGIAHFGFRLVDPDDIDRAIAEVERAGGRLLRRGEFAPGLPYASKMLSGWPLFKMVFPISTVPPFQKMPPPLP
jgi:catechol 2,3-dioxygenase-like lactoylglutathione lyase family enzyme